MPREGSPTALGGEALGGTPRVFCLLGSRASEARMFWAPSWTVERPRVPVRHSPQPTRHPPSAWRGFSVLGMILGFALAAGRHSREQRAGHRSDGRGSARTSGTHSSLRGVAVPMRGARAGLVPGSRSSQGVGMLRQRSPDFAPSDPGCGVHWSGPQRKDSLERLRCSPSSA